MFGSQNALPWQQSLLGPQLNPVLGLPQLSGPGVALAAAQHASSLNPNAGAFCPAPAQQAAGSQAPVSLGPDRSTVPDTGTALSTSAAVNSVKPIPALSPVLEPPEYSTEEGELADSDDAENDQAPARKRGAQQATKKPLQFLGINCPSEAQIEWQGGSFNRVVFRDVAETARKMSQFRKRHLSGCTNAAQVSDYNDIAKHLQRSINHIKLAEEFGWEAVGKVVQNPLAADPALSGKVKKAREGLDKDKSDAAKTRGQPRFRGRGGGAGAARSYYAQPQQLFGQQQQPAFGQQLAATGKPVPLLQPNVAFH
ncbi:MAG: hypothetical protein GY835_28090, partial [bacterium]|nr:hypothetical protein [bacterium]